MPGKGLRRPRPAAAGGRFDVVLGAVGWAGGAFLGGVLVFGGVVKALDPQAFVRQIEIEGLDFLLPAVAVTAIALALEMGLGSALMLGLRRMWVLAPSALLVAFFLFLTGRSYYRDLRGIAALPPDPTTVMFQLDIGAALDVSMITVVLAFLFTDMFDTSGTLIAVAHRAGLLDEDGRLPRLRRALLADSAATVVGAAAGTSSVTSCVESTAGVRAGGRTGLTAVVVAALFLATLLLEPLATSIPAYATAPALVFVACIMARSLIEIDWNDVTEYVPAVALAMTMAFTFSISEGLAVGCVCYVVVKALGGRHRTMRPAVVVLAALFLARYMWL